MATLQKTLAQDKQVIVEVRDRINNIYNQKKYPYKNITLRYMYKELDSTFVVTLTLVSIITLG